MGSDQRKRPESERGVHTSGSTSGATPGAPLQPPVQTTVGATLAGPEQAPLRAACPDRPTVLQNAGTGPGTRGTYRSARALETFHQRPAYRTAVIRQEQQHSYYLRLVQWAPDIGPQIQQQAVHLSRLLLIETNGHRHCVRRLRRGPVHEAMGYGAAWPQAPVAASAGAASGSPIRYHCPGCCSSVSIAMPCPALPCPTNEPTARHRQACPPHPKACLDRLAHHTPGLAHRPGERERVSTSS